MNLKNDKAFVRMSYLAGNRDLIHTCLYSLAGGDGTDLSAAATSTTNPSPMLRITQRMRLESTQLEGVQWKLREPANYCMCLALAATPPQPTQQPPLMPLSPSSSSRQSQLDQLYDNADNDDLTSVAAASLNALVLQRNFINYLQEKMAAGIISCPSPLEVMHFSFMPRFVILLLVKF